MIQRNAMAAAFGALKPEAEKKFLEALDPED
jgi:hypothetical protein